MAEFNEEQTNFYNSLISQNIDAQTANDLTTGKLSAADYKASLEKNIIDIIEKRQTGKEDLPDIPL